MLRSLYTAGTGMLVQRYRMNVTTNNIVNAQTNGYKKDTLLSRSFADMMLTRVNDPNVLSHRNDIGDWGPGIHIDEVITSFTGGTTEATERMSDLAIEGDGFFVVNTPQGERYTRDGALYVSIDGYLMNADGHPLQSTTGGNVYVGFDGFSVDGLGNVTINGQRAGQIRLVAFEDNGALRKAGHNMFYNYGNSPMAEPDAYIRQYALESSNVSIVDEMVEMMQLSRSYDTNQRIVRMIDETLQKTVNDVGRL
ncbi:flagellar hook-basal body complex protein [Eubacteriales bacterium OttesenSCG-928-N14]|nr:flagellar hook-basal body complex protein [Eubacteriales bacterium OttesenSCG-928-N14]